jgi:2-methylaconitate cis-trans-isomerase PrpF
VPDDQFGVPCVFMRGGTSRGALFLESDIPSEPGLRDAFLLAAFGSPDTRQIDGIGGADPLTSKALVIAPSARADSDVEYLFAQVGIDKAEVSYGGNCGNMLAAVGPYAIDHGLVEAVEPVTTVRIFNRNTNSRIVAEVPVARGVARTTGDCAIAGVPRDGARIALNFLDAAGAVTQKLVPTGQRVDRLSVDDCSYEVSIIDAATPFVFVPAEQLGLSGTELPEELAANTALFVLLEKLRLRAAAAIGLEGRSAGNIPRVAIVSAPRDYIASTGVAVAGDEVEIVVRQLAMGRPHRTLAVTGSICLAVAARLPGTVVAQLALPREREAVRIGHPAGALRVEISIDGETIHRAAIERTARRILEGTLYVPASVLAQSPA